MMEIIGKYVFGCGQDDPTQYTSSQDEDYIGRQDDGAFALNVARQYGAKPVTQIRVDTGIIDVYMLLDQYAAELRRTDGLVVKADHTWVNTVNPAAIVDYFCKHSVD